MQKLQIRCKPKRMQWYHKIQTYQLCYSIKSTKTSILRKTSLEYKIYIYMLLQHLPISVKMSIVFLYTLEQLPENFFKITFTYKTYYRLDVISDLYMAREAA